jgi:DNA-binding XRE family transcriptional regulator
MVANEKSVKMHNRLAELRTARGLSAAELAAAIGVSRQTVYAIESGDYAPNTTVALRLAEALGVAVEEIFQLETQTDSPNTEKAELLEESTGAAPGKPVCLCRVDSRLVATFPEATAWSLPLADAMITGAAARSNKQAKISVKLFAPAKDLDKRLLMAGCDPGISILGRHLGQQGVNLVVAHRNTAQGLSTCCGGEAFMWPAVTSAMKRQTNPTWRLLTASSASGTSRSFPSRSGNKALLCQAAIQSRFVPLPTLNGRTFPL